MDNTCYIHYSEPLVEPIFTDRGYFPVRGIHALAGLEVVESPFQASSRDGLLQPEKWLEGMALFWLALAYRPNNQDDGYQTSFELRLGKSSRDETLSVSLWVKTFARDDLQAALSLEYWMGQLTRLLPPACMVKPISSQTAFYRTWGNLECRSTGEPSSGALSEPTWLAELRRPEPLQDQASKGDEPAAYYHIADWQPTLPAWLKVWEFLSRVNGNLWLSVGVCPTFLLPAEADLLEEWSDLDDNLHAGMGRLYSLPGYWLGKKRHLENQSYLLRVRLGGEQSLMQSMTRQVYAGSIAGGVQEDLERVSLNKPAWSPRNPQSYSAKLVWPETILDWDTARFNWQWGEFKDWGSNEKIPPHLARFPYLATTGEVALLAGIWA